MRELDEPAGRCGPAADGPCLDRPSVGPVQASSLGRQQFVVCRLLDERVAERVSIDVIVRRDDQELCGDDLAQGDPEVGLGQSAYLGEQVVVHLPTGHRCDLDEAARSRRHRRETDQQDAAQRVREAIALAAGLVTCGDELLREERVAVRATWRSTRRARRTAGRPRWRSGSR